MRRLLALIALTFGPLMSVTALADTAPGCLAIPPDPITWTLPTTPVGPSWSLASNALGPTSGAGVPFTARFWRRPECSSQLILTLDVTAQFSTLGSFSVFQSGQVAPFLSMTVNDPTVYGSHNLPLYLLPSAPISGVVDQLNIFGIDVNQAMLITYTPSWPVLTRPLPVTLEIPAAGTSGPTAFTIGPGITGSWYDPAQSGHGFSIEVLTGNTLLADWYVYSPTGGQAWIAAMGPITGNTAVLQGYQKVGAGGRFPPYFNASELTNQLWGTLTFTFTDCNNGTASWQPTIAGYTSGSIPITRLTMPAGLACP